MESAELLAALALATDLGTGQPLEHALRTCLVANAMAERAEVGEDERGVVHLLALLHAIGCTSDAHEAARDWGDDLRPRERYSVIDAAKPGQLITFIWEASGGNPVRFARGMAAGPRRPRAGLAAHCEVGRSLASTLSLPEAVLDGLGFVFERWDGKGFPAGVAGDAIPWPMRVVHVARDAVALSRVETVEDVATAIRVRRAYDPEVAALFDVGMLSVDPAWDAVLERAPAVATEPDAACRAVALFTDLKSVFTLGHSTGVAEVAEASAWRLGLDADAVRRAALLHDLGRAGVSTRIWEKEGALSDGEWERVRLHPYLTGRALARCSALGDLGRVAALHHERLDGSGYPGTVTAGGLSAEARVLAAADVWQAMAEPRPHRPALAPDAAAGELRGEVRAGRLDANAVEALLSAVGERGERARPPLPAGLTEREAEVLALLARGSSNKQIAAALGIAPRTAGHHVEHVYAKLGVSTRAAAALVAVEHGVIAP
jgi:putative nucleotidyltransferase with HDIG domain